LVRQFELAHWLIVPGQNSQVAVTVFYREVCDFRVLRNPSRIGGRRGDHFLQADFRVLIRAVPILDYFRIADNSRRDRQNSDTCEWDGDVSRYFEEMRIFTWNVQRLANPSLIQNRDSE